MKEQDDAKIQEEEVQYHVDGCIFNCSYAEEQASSEVLSDDTSNVEREWNVVQEYPTESPPPNANRASNSSLLDNDD
jgi:hypothetical protein